MAETEQTMETAQKMANETGVPTEVKPAGIIVEPGEKPAAVKELKIVLIVKNNRALIGVQSPDCDPVYETMDGDLAAALPWVPKTVEMAKLRWATNKRNPKADLPKPPIPTPVATSSQPTGTTKKKAAAVAAATPPQPKFF